MIIIRNVIRVWMFSTWVEKKLLGLHFLLLLRYNQKNSNDTRDDYLTLFVKTIKKEFDEVTFGRGIFTTSTPSNGGLGTEIEVNPNSFTAGDGECIDIIRY